MLSTLHRNYLRALDAAHAGAAATLESQAHGLIEKALDLSSPAEAGCSAVIDIETLDHTPRSVITEMGIVIFDRATFEPTYWLDLQLDIFDQIAVRSVSQDTIDFHRRNGTLPKLDGGLSRFIAGGKIAEFFGTHKPKRVWIQGPCFERPIIEDVFADLGQPLPWHFTRSRDCRTNWDTAFPDVPHPKRPHRALDDALETLLCLEKALTALNRRNAC